MTDEPHKAAMMDAIAAEAEAQRALLDGRGEEAADGYRRAVELWWRSWEIAPPRSYGRLIGMVKAAVIAGDARDAAARVRAHFTSEPDSPPSSYALAIAALAAGEDGLAARAAGGMRGGSEPFVRAADAIAALATGDEAGYEAALSAVVADFEARDEHLTGVPIADTAVMLERLAEPRGMAVHPRSRVLPPPPG